MTRRSIRAVAALAAAIAGVIAALAVGASVPAAARASHAPQAALAAARASHAPESIFQDDDHLIYADSATVAHVLNLLQALGVDRIRVTIEWKYIAPNPSSTTEPAGFDATNPNDYTMRTFGGSPGIWDPYDRVIEMAEARGIGVDFNVTAPGPLWAMRPAPVTTQFGTRPADHYEPSATDFGEFVQALGTRYSGTYVPPVPPPPPTTTTTNPLPITIPMLPPLITTTTTTTTTTTSTTAATALPRVHYWSIWNEPDQPGWLAPQWRTVGKQRVPDSPRLYRSLVDAAVGALDVTGHTLSSDTILVGETAPEGDIDAIKVHGRERYYNYTGFYDAMTPMVFVRALYCVNSSNRRLTGTAASALGCPTSGSAHAFVTENPGLFYATGFAHHPYFFLFAPNYSSPVANFVPLADLGRLERGLNGIFATYGVNRKIPIYLTEYGYQTNPPDPYQVVTPAEQAVYLNEADYMAWRDPRVRSVSQFLLYDAGPDPTYPPSSYDYWDTFQTGLLYGPGTSRDGRQKPAYDAYRLPIWIPTQTVRRRAKMLIWGMLRLAPKDTAQKALIQWSPPRHGRYRTIATASVPASAVYGYFTIRVTPPGTGRIRIAWRSAAATTYTSRVVAVTVGARRPANSTSGPEGATPLVNSTPTG
jgi:hypothetical protein